jgi:asparagine synthase (glutamine-hydrolysing)
MEQARAANVPVLLEGQGADEALGGYLQYAVIELIAAVSGTYDRRPGMGELLQRLRCLGSTFSLPWAAAWLARELCPGLLHRHRQWTGFQSLLRKGFAVPEAPSRPAIPGDPVWQRLIEDHAHDILPGLLHYGDAISMAHSIETRHPFMDYRLVEWMFRLPTGMRFIDGQTKWVLREYLRRHDQQAIADRPDKKGYPTPVGDWMARDDGREIEHLLAEPRGLLQEWCDPEKIRRLIRQNRRGAMSAEHHLYKLLSTQLWLDQCFEPRPVPVAPEPMAVGG